MNLIQLSPIYFINDTSKITLTDGCIEIGEEQFIAIGLEKSRVAENWEGSDYFNVIILIKAIDKKYYIAKIEHRANILSPQYTTNDNSIFWVEENISAPDRELISNLYTLEDSRSTYTLTVHEQLDRKNTLIDKSYIFYEKYLCYLMSVSYELWGIHDESAEVSPFLRVHCQLSSNYSVSALDYLPMRTLRYSIDICSLLQTSVFQHCPFKVWDGDVTINKNSKQVTLKYR